MRCALRGYETHGGDMLPEVPTCKVKSAPTIQPNVTPEVGIARDRLCCKLWGYELQALEPRRTLSVTRQSYTPELGAEVLTRISGGESLRKISLSEYMPSREALRLWVRGEAGAPEDYPVRYAEARRARAELLAEQVIEIADGIEEAATAAADEAVRELREENQGQARPRTEAKLWRRTFHERLEAAKVRIDARKWSASKMDPHSWGDRVQHDIGGQQGKPLRIAAPDTSSLTPEEVEAGIRITEKLIQSGAIPSDDDT